MDLFTGTVRVQAPIIYVYTQSGAKICDTVALRQCRQFFKDQPVSFDFRYEVDLRRGTMIAYTTHQGQEIALHPMGVSDLSKPLYFMSTTLNPQIIFDLQLPAGIGNAKIVYDNPLNSNLQCIIASQEDSSPSF
jgi:hypothetical protein